MKKNRFNILKYKKNSSFFCKYTGTEVNTVYQNYLYFGKSRYLLDFLAKSSDWVYYSSRYGNFKVVACSVQFVPAAWLRSTVEGNSSPMKFGAFCYDPAPNLSPLSDRLVVGSIANRPGTLFSTSGFKVKLKLPALPLLPVSDIINPVVINKYGVISHAFEYAIPVNSTVQSTYAVYTFSFSVLFEDPSISGLIPNPEVFTNTNLYSKMTYSTPLLQQNSNDKQVEEEKKEELIPEKKI